MFVFSYPQVYPIISRDRHLSLCFSDSLLDGSSCLNVIAVLLYIRHVPQWPVPVGEGARAVSNPRQAALAASGPAQQGVRPGATRAHAWTPAGGGMTGS